MTLRQRLRGILTTDPHISALFAAQIDFSAPGTIAERMQADWEGSTVRDAVLRDAATRIAVTATPAAVAYLWRFADGSVLTANEQGVWAR